MLYNRAYRGYRMQVETADLHGKEHVIKVYIMIPKYNKEAVKQGTKQEWLTLATRDTVGQAKKFINQLLYKKEGK